MTAPSPWWHPARHSDRRPLLLARTRIKSAVREWFTSQGFIEIETACLQRSPGNETHLHAFATERIAPDRSRQRLYLHTSPEFAMKKLLAAGETRIFSLQPVFRNREFGPLHQPEFMMLEWYRAGEPSMAIMDDCHTLFALACKVTGATLVSYRGVTADACAVPERITVAEAFSRHAGIDLMSALSGDGCDRERFAGLAGGAGLTVRDDDTWSDIFSRILAALVEPKLGVGRPSLIYDYPLAEAALARAKNEDPRLGERFELYCCNVELANGFNELTDADVQRDRLEKQMAEKQRIYGERYPVDEDFLEALSCMPQASGAALGFDRLVMLATGASRIDQIMWTPLPDPRDATGNSK